MLHIEPVIMAILLAICILSLCVLNNGRPTTMIIYSEHEAGDSKTISTKPMLHGIRVRNQYRIQSNRSYEVTSVAESATLNMSVVVRIAGTLVRMTRNFVT